MARHAKLNANASSQHTLSSLPKKLFFGRFARGLAKSSGKRPVHTFVKRVASLSAAFFIVSSLSTFDYYFQSTAVQGYYEGGIDGYEYGGTDMGMDDLATQPMVDALNDVVEEEEGFVVKPNLSLEEGDYSSVKDIMVHHVQPGETVASIAEQYGIRQETVMEVNYFYDANQLKPGMDITVLPVDGVTHKVQKGESLSKIASDFKVSVQDIMRQNQLEEGDTIVPDMVLIIPNGRRVIEPPKPPEPPKPVNNNRPSNNAVNNVSATASAPAAPSGPATTNYVYDGPTSGGHIHPVPGGCIVTQGYHGGHYAVDCANRSGGEIVASAAGTVIKAYDDGWGGGYGYHVIVQHEDGSQTLYAHCKVLYVSEGEWVPQGGNLCFMGTTGRSTGVHLHYEIRSAGGVKQSPFNYINW